MQENGIIIEQKEFNLLTLKSSSKTSNAENPPLFMMAPSAVKKIYRRDFCNVQYAYGTYRVPGQYFGAVTHIVFFVTAAAAV